jgi:hypothetical protein
MTNDEVAMNLKVLLYHRVISQESYPATGEIKTVLVCEVAYKDGSTGWVVETRWKTLRGGGTQSLPEFEIVTAANAKFLLDNAEVPPNALLA